MVSERDILMTTVKRGDIYCADLDPVVGSEQGGIRPVLVIQNNWGNRFSPTVVVVAITSRQHKAALPTHVPLAAGEAGLTRPSVVLAEQMRTLDGRRLRRKLGALGEERMREVDGAIRASLAIGE